MHHRLAKTSVVPDLPAELLGLVGRELAELAAEMQSLQVTLSPSLVDIAKVRAEAIGSFQALDRMEQTLTNLSRLMWALQAQGSTIHPDAAQGALEAISMADLRRRLGCLILARTASNKQNEAELF